VRAVSAIAEELRGRAVIWDFNGTLVNDVDLALRSINTMLTRRGLAPVTRDVYRRAFGFPLADYYRKLGVDLSRETMAGLADEFHAAYLPELPKCELHVGVKEILDLVHNAGGRQFVLSALEEGALRDAVERLGIGDCFGAVYGLDHRLGDSKLARGRELAERYGLSNKATLFVGDMDHDAEVARALDIPVALVAQGHQAPETLRACGCRVFETFAELRTAIETSLV
jgi:phosphoglycolate phosphatase